MNRFLKCLCAVILYATLGACAVVNISNSTQAPLPRDARWVLLPIQNHTETPQAGLRAETILVRDGFVTEGSASNLAASWR